MAIKLTDEQLKTVKSMVGFAECFSDQLLHIMKNHNLDKVEGCKIMISVEPSCLFATELIMLGDEKDDDFGKVTLTKGIRKGFDKFVPTGKNSAEYELLFADEAIRERMEKILREPKPLPPDGLWIGDTRYDAPVDSRNKEWDVNDSLS